MELYKEYRPRTLDEVAGNEATKRQLRTMFDSEQIPHALLFTGPSGAGKTTFARIVKEELDCSDYDYVEFDSVDMSGVDYIRELRRKMVYAPSKGKTRVYLLDECHALGKRKSGGNAQEALLKALEECPDHVYFILATTDPQELLPTLKSRCTTFTVEKLPASTIGRDILLPVCKKEKIHADKEVIKKIAEDCQGSARVAMVLLDSIRNLEPSDMLDAVRVAVEAQNQTIELCRALMKGNYKTCSAIAKGLKEEPESVRRAVLGYFTAVLLNSGTGRAYDVLRAFENNYFDVGKAGLAMSIFESCK